MYRTSYEMTEADLKKLLDACKPTPVLFLTGGVPLGSSPQENANRAWAELGERMGFDCMTVEPTGRGDRFFTAVPKETKQHKRLRLAREAEENRLQEIETLRVTIATCEARLNELTNFSARAGDAVAPLVPAGPGGATPPPG